MADCTPISQFEWTDERSKAALGLAEGKIQQEVADDVGVSRRTICNWLCEPEFAAEVDRLSLMIGIASKAERVRLAMRVVRQKTKGEIIATDKDLLEWLKFAQSETHGVKLDLGAIAAAFNQDETPVAGSGPTAEPEYPN